MIYVLWCHLARGDIFFAEEKTMLNFTEAELYLAFTNPETGTFQSRLLHGYAEFVQRGHFVAPRYFLFLKEMWEAFDGYTTYTYAINEIQGTIEVDKADCEAGRASPKGLDKSIAFAQKTIVDFDRKKKDCLRTIEKGVAYCTEHYEEIDAASIGAVERLHGRLLEQPDYVPDGVFEKIREVKEIVVD